MEYSKLVAVTGMPGLYELINSKNDGAIVRSLDDNTTKFASGRIHNFSHLESIEVYTVRDNVNLVEVFHAMDAAGGTLPDGKDNAVLKKYFQGAYPELDFDRVYSSDLKKMVKWFEVLKKNNVEIKLSELPEEEEMETVSEVAEETPTKKSSAKKEAAAAKTVTKETSAATSGNATAATAAAAPATKKETLAKTGSTPKTDPEAKKKTAAKPAVKAAAAEKKEEPKTAAKKTAAKKK